jgi:hypothetical protein
VEAAHFGGAVVAVGAVTIEEGALGGLAGGGEGEEEGEEEDGREAGRHGSNILLP